MKLKINKTLRQALYTCLGAVCTTTLSSAVLYTVATVSFALVSEQAQAELLTFTTPEAGTTLADLDNLTAEDTLILDTPAGGTYLPVPGTGGTLTIEAPTFVKSMVISGFSTNRGYTFAGGLSDFKHYTGDGADPAAAVAHFQVTAGTDNVNKRTPLRMTFSGVMSNFEGNIESKKDGANFTFSTAAGVDVTARNASASGRGALIVGGRQVTYNMSGTVTVNNSSILVSNTIDGNAVTAGGDALNTGLNFQGAATYNVSATVTADNLSVAAGTTVSFTKAVTSNTSLNINGSVTLAGVGHSFVGTTTVADGASLSVAGDLSIGGRLNLFESITGAGSLSFLDTALIDLSNLEYTADGMFSTYKIHEGGTTNFDALSIANLTGITGLSAETYNATFDNATGSLTLELRAALLGYAGSADASSPAALAWTNGGDTVFTSGGENVAYSPNAIVTFAAGTHTDATIQEIIRASTISLEQDASLILSTGDTGELILASANLGAGASLTVNGNFLSSPIDELIVLTGVASSELHLMNSHIDSSGRFDFSSYAGSVILKENMGMTVDTAASLGAISQITVEQDAALFYAGGITPNMSMLRGTGTLELNGSASYADGTHIDFAGDIVVSSGTLTFGVKDSNTARLEAASVTLNSGTNFTMVHAGADFTDTDINMRGATLHGGDVGPNSNGGIRLGKLTSSGTNTISFQWNGIFSFTELTGEGTVNFNAAGEVGELHLLGVTDFDGTLNFAAGGSDDKILISGIMNQSADKTMLLSGRVIEAEAVTYRGAGTVSYTSGLKSWGHSKQLSGTVNVNDFQFGNTANSMTVLGGSFNITGATLNSAVDGTFSVGAATVGTSEAGMTIADNIQLGAYTAEGLPADYTPATAGTAAAPITTTISTDQSDGGGAAHITITGNLSDVAGSVGALRVTGAGSLTLSGTHSFSGGIAVESGASLFLAGTWDYAAAITNGGNLTFGADMMLDISGVSFVENAEGGFDLVLVNGTTGLDASAWLNGGALNEDKVTGLIAGRTYTYADGVISYTTDANTHNISTGTTIAVGSEINGTAFAQGDNVNISGLATAVTLTGSIEMAALSLTGFASTITGTAGESLTVESLTAQGTNLAINGVDLHASTITILDESILTVENGLNAAQVTVGANAFLAAGSLDTATVTLSSGASLELTEALAEGSVALDAVSGGSDTSLYLALADAGTTVAASGFTGTLNVVSGKLVSSYAGLNSFAATVLGANVEYDITDTLGSGVVDLLKLEGGATSQLNVQLTDGTGATRMQMSSDFKGIVNITAGDLSAFSTVGGVSKFILNTGTGLIFNASGSGAEFTGNIEIAAGVSAEFRSYGTKTESFYRVLSGAVTGAADSTIYKTDGGTIQFDNLAGYYGNILIDSASRIVINSDTSNLNTITMRNASELVIATDKEVSINRFVGTDYTASSSILKVAEGATLTVKGTDTGASQDSSFVVSHYNGTTGTVDIAGHLVLNSGISAKDGASIVNVAATGELTLKQGLYGAANYSHITLNTVSGSTLNLGNQTAESQLVLAPGDDNIQTNIAAGTNIVATDETTNVLNTLKLSGTGNVNLTAKSTVKNVNVQDIISNIDGSSAGLTITGTSSQTFTLSGANTYAGDTVLNGAKLVAGNDSAFGSGNVMVESGTLDLSGRAIANDITINGGTIENVHTLTGALTMEGGSITLEQQMAGTEDVTINGGTFTLKAGLDAAVGAELLGDRNFYVAGSSSKQGTLDLSSYDVSGSITVSGSGIILNDGRGSGDLIIKDDSDATVSNETNRNITMEGPGSIAKLAEGFSQGASSVISGEGIVELQSGSDITLSNANTYTGGTELSAGTALDETHLTIAGADAAGEGALQLADHSRITIASGVVLDNDLSHENGNNELLSGDLTVTGRATDTSYSSGATSTGDLVENVRLTNADVVLAANGTGAIRNTTLINTDVKLEEGSTLTLENVHIGADTLVHNADAKSIMKDNIITSKAGVSLIGPDEQKLATLENKDGEMMQVYSLTNLDLKDVEFEGSLTLNIDMDDTMFEKFELTMGADGGIVGFELANVKNADALDRMFYGRVTINILHNSVLQDNYVALGHTLSESGSLVFYIPEPSTATLSLLALAGMLLRRRRKQEA